MTLETQVVGLLQMGNRKKRPGHAFLPSLGLGLVRCQVNEG